MPITDIDEDMPKWGWVKEIRYEQVFDINNKPVLMEWIFYANELQCPHCKKTDRTWLWVPPHDYAGGVFLGCSQCKKVYGPLDLEAHSSNHIDRGFISLERLVEICDRTKQPIPANLAKKVSQMRLGARIQKRPLPPRVGEKKRIGRPPK